MKMAMEHLMGDSDETFFDADVEDSDEMESLPMMVGSEPVPDNFDNDRLERCGRWLLSIPRDDVIALRQTPEYEEFLQAFDRLGHAHRRVATTNRNRMDLEPIGGIEQVPPGNLRRSVSSFSFLQHLAVDDVILRVFEFLECDTLTRTSETCSRFRELANRSATQRTRYVARSRQLNNVMKLLRAKEHIDGIGHSLFNCHVRVPMLLLSRRILVTNSGDPEYNGVYFCTSSNGNGFVFTKPRSPEQRRVVSLGTILAPPPPHPMPVGEGGVFPPALPFGQAAQNRPTVNDDDEDAISPGHLLRCVIAKRFSNETILWYMSKEIETISNIGSMVEVTQEFSFWAKLMMRGDVPPTEYCYPSQTSVLSRNGDPAWQSLVTTATSEPPIVELLD